MLTRQLELLKEKIRKLQQLARDKLIVVEGKSDRAALEQLVKSDFFLLSATPKSLDEAAEEIAAKEKDVILALDTDRAGKKLAKILLPKLSALGVKVDTKTVPELLRAAKVNTVEGLIKSIREVENG